MIKETFIRLIISVFEVCNELFCQQKKNKSTETKGEITNLVLKENQKQI